MDCWLIAKRDAVFKTPSGERVAGTPGVLLVAPEDDAHARVVAAALNDLAVKSVQCDIAAAAAGGLTVVPAEYVAIGDQVIEDGWSVWWRRAGVAAPRIERIDAEARLAADESRDIVLGGLFSLGLRWVDDPYTVMRAEQTLLQLACARRVGARTPGTIATNVPDAGRAMAADGPVLAKAISSGSGLAPFAEEIDDSAFRLLPAAPTVLQQQIKKRSDLRLVVIGADVFCWARPTLDGEPVDWRAADRKGWGFVPVEHPEVASLAVKINASLGLGFGVHDWVIDNQEQAVFLEVNPTGAWLFLASAREVVAPALARFLAQT